MREDFLGNPLEIGDEVVLAAGGRTGTISNLRVGVVIGFKSVMIEVSIKTFRRYRGEEVELHILRKPTALMKLVR